MKTQEELNVLKEEVENMNKKLAELTEEELEQLSAGVAPVLPQETEDMAIKLHNRVLNDFPKGKPIGVDTSKGKYDTGRRDLPKAFADNQKEES